VPVVGPTELEVSCRAGKYTVEGGLGLEYDGAFGEY
jgi:hypothetical protein